jgi:hypothetical protein
MIPFEDLVASLERFKMRKSTPSAVVPVAQPTSGKVVSGKQQAQRQQSLTELADLLPED